MSQLQLLKCFAYIYDIKHFTKLPKQFFKDIIFYAGFSNSIFFKCCTAFKIPIRIPELNFSERFNSGFLTPLPLSRLSISLRYLFSIFSMIFSSNGFLRIALTPSFLHSSIGSSLLSVCFLGLAPYDSRIITLVQHSSSWYGVSPSSELAERCKGEHPF